MKRNKQDLSETDVRERLCPACRVTVADLDALDFPEPSYIVAGEKFWTFAAVAMWIDARVRASAHCGQVQETNLVEVVRLVFWMKGVPDMTEHEAMHLAVSALVDMHMQRIFGVGMRGSATQVSQ